MSSIRMRASVATVGSSWALSANLGTNQRTGAPPLHAFTISAATALLLEAADRRPSTHYAENVAPGRRSRTKRANEGERAPWHRTYRYVRYRMPGRRLDVNEALRVPDAPLTPRGKLIRCTILDVLLAGVYDLIALA